MIVHHSIRVRASAKDIYPMLLEWGAGDWWPEGSRLRCEGFTQVAGAVGSRFRCGICGLLGFSWDAEVISASEGSEVSRRLAGSLDGVERLYIIPGRSACEVHVLLDFAAATGLKVFIWNLALAKTHETAVRDALSALKWRLEGTDENDDPEGPLAGSLDNERRRFLKNLIWR